MSKEWELSYQLTYRDAVELLRVVRESEFCEEMAIEIGDMKLRVARRLEHTSTAPQVRSHGGRAPIVDTSTENFHSHPTAPTAASGEGLQPVVAPMLGTFYRATAPGEPPCVQEGDVIGAEHTIGLIEVMKLFTPIAAGVAGRVAKVLVDDATLVEYRQPLVLIEPC